MNEPSFTTRTVLTLTRNPAIVLLIIILIGRLMQRVPMDQRNPRLLLERTLLVGSPVQELVNLISYLILQLIQFFVVWGQVIFIWVSNRIQFFVVWGQVVFLLVSNRISQLIQFFVVWGRDILLIMCSSLIFYGVIRFVPTHPLREAIHSRNNQRIVEVIHYPSLNDLQAYQGIQASKGFVCGVIVGQHFRRQFPWRRYENLQNQNQALSRQVENLQNQNRALSRQVVTGRAAGVYLYHQGVRVSALYLRTRETLFQTREQALQDQILNEEIVAGQEHRIGGLGIVIQHQERRREEESSRHRENETALVADLNTERARTSDLMDKVRDLTQKTDESNNLIQDLLARNKSLEEENNNLKSKNQENSNESNQ